MTIAIQILIAFILSNANPVKAEAREYLKKQLSGWKERVALAVFDAAWDAAMAAVGGKAGIVSMNAADELVAGIVEADKASVA
jgi:hypothetical protein